MFKGASEEESGEREGSVALVVVSGIVITFSVLPSGSLFFGVSPIRDELEFVPLGEVSSNNEFVSED